MITMWTLLGSAMLTRRPRPWRACLGRMWAARPRVAHASPASAVLCTVGVTIALNLVQQVHLHEQLFAVVPQAAIFTRRQGVERDPMTRAALSGDFVEVFNSKPPQVFPAAPLFT